MSKPRCHNETVCQCPTLPSTNSHSPVAHLSASLIFHAQIILFHSFVVFCLFFSPLGGVGGDADRKHVQRETESKGAPSAGIRAGMSQPYGSFLNHQATRMPLNPTVRISRHRARLIKLSKHTNLRQHDCSSSSSASRSGGILSATATAGLKSRTVVGPTDFHVKCFPRDLLAGGSWVGIQ